MTQGKPFLITPLLPALSKSCHILYSVSKNHTSLYELAHLKPKEAFLLLDDPQTPELANLKAYVLLRMKKKRQAEEVIIENYKRYPETLSIRLNYADLCLRKRELKKVGKIFPSYDLSLLYPEKTSFLASEFLGFVVFMGHYHFKIKNRALAEQFYVLAVKANPLHPSVTALEKKLFSFSVLKKLLGRIFKSW